MDGSTLRRLLFSTVAASKRVPEAAAVELHLNLAVLLNAGDPTDSELRELVMHRFYHHAAYPGWTGMVAPDAHDLIAELVIIWRTK